MARWELKGCQMKIDSPRLSVWRRRTRAVVRAVSLVIGLTACPALAGSPPFWSWPEGAIVNVVPTHTLLTLLINHDHFSFVQVA